jgi:hypothetical protein
VRFLHAARLALPVSAKSMSHNGRAVRGDRDGLMSPPRMGVDLLLIDRLVFFVGLLFVFLRLFFGFLLPFILLAFISQSFLLRFFDFSV